jgi:hypothetical protein
MLLYCIYSLLYFLISFFIADIVPTHSAHSRLNRIDKKILSDLKHD